jgi:hypothetical protein
MQVVTGKGECAEKSSIKTVNPVDTWYREVSCHENGLCGINNSFDSTLNEYYEQEILQPCDEQKPEDIDLLLTSDLKSEDFKNGLYLFQTSSKSPSFNVIPCLNTFVPKCVGNNSNTLNIQTVDYQDSKPSCQSTTSDYPVSHWTPTTASSQSSNSTYTSPIDVDDTKLFSHDLNTESIAPEGVTARSLRDYKIPHPVTRSVERDRHTHHTSGEETVQSSSNAFFEFEPSEELVESNLPGRSLSQDSHTFGTQPFPPPPPPRDPQQVAADAVRRTWEDEFILHGRELKWTFKQIKQKGGFTCAESTLRGRYRSLTKCKNERVRRPIWKPRDEILLLDAVRTLSSLDRIQQVLSSADTQTLGVSWQDVAEYIKNNGGSYRFGNSTCKKKWMQLNDIPHVYSKH